MWKKNINMELQLPGMEEDKRRLVLLKFYLNFVYYRHIQLINMHEKPVSISYIYTLIYIYFFVIDTFFVFDIN